MNNRRSGAGPLSAMAALEHNPGAMISRADVYAWMRSHDLRILGITDVFLEQWADLVSPPLLLDEIDEFRRVFCRRYFRENPDDDHAPSRSAAGWELAKWLMYLMDAPEGGEPSLARWREWLAQEYAAGDADVRECVITAILAHVFHALTSHACLRRGIGMTS